MKTAIVKLSDYSIMTSYDGSPNQASYGSPWGDPAEYEHVSYDENAIGPEVKAQDNAGTTEIVNDLQLSRNSKLAEIRIQRSVKLEEVDIMCNELAVGDRADAAAVKTYRTDLLDITDSYKDGGDPMVGDPAIDALADDISDITWPTKP